jgi:phospholipid/cholesterol/gamma-HCH transport system substrate-binding protein
MEPRANHVLIGVFTLAGLALLLLLGLWSARWASDQAWSEYEIVFKHPVAGLSIGSTVQYNGIAMGSVRDLYLHPDDPATVIAQIRLESQAPVREDTTARLAVSGLTGVSTIQLRGGSPDSPPLVAGPGRSLPRIEAEESALQRLLETSEDIATTASKVMLRLVDLLSEENVARVSDALDQIDRFTRVLGGESSRIETILANVEAGSAELPPLMRELRTTVADVNQALERIEPSLLETFPEAGEELREAMQKLARASERIDRMVAANEPAVAGFGRDVLTPLGPTVEELQRLIDELSALTERFERDPAGFLLGGERPEEYEPQ